MDKIKDHQELLDRYYQAETGLVWEYSNSIPREIKEVQEQVKEYAQRNGLHTDFIKEDD